MKKRPLSLVVAVAIALSSPAISDDFYYSYSDVFQATAENYTVDLVNVQKINEGIVHYYCPITLDAPAYLTYHFTFAGAVSDARLFAHLASYNFGNGVSGFGSLWGSANGSMWQLLMDAPTPSSRIDMGYFYDSSLPSSMLGGNDIWIQARMQASGWDIMSQFSRTDINVPVEIFRLNAVYVPEPSTYALFGLGAIGMLMVLRRKKTV
jgi:hypothetical protein